MVYPDEASSRDSFRQTWLWHENKIKMASMSWLVKGFVSGIAQNALGYAPGSGCK